MAPPVNVWVDGRWFGPSYPDAGDPPAGAVDEHVFADRDEAGEGGVGFAPPPAPAPVAPLDGPVVVDDGSGNGGEDDGDQDPADDDPPRRSGPGSGLPRWIAYARAHGVDVDDDASRDDVIAACERAGVRTD